MNNQHFDSDYLAERTKYNRVKAQLLSTSHKLKWFVWPLLVLLAGGTGFLLGNRQTTYGQPMPVESQAALENFITQDSFSEIQNAKATLEGLARRYRVEVQSKRVLDSRSTADTQGAARSREPHLAGTISVIEQGLEEFKGTEQELELTEELLLALRTAKLYDRWLCVYLRALYEHPTGPTAIRFENDAMMIGGICGRQEEVIRGFRHLSDNPYDVRNKAEVSAFLAKYDKLHSDVGADPLAPRPR